MPAPFEWAFTTRGSAVEGWDPRVELVSMALVMVALLVHHNLVLKSVQVVLLVLVWVGARLGWLSLGLAVLAVSPLLATTAISAFLILVPGFEPAVRAATLDLQIVGVVLVLTLLVRTTAPTALAEGLERLLAPLGRRGLPVHEAVLMFSIALRFVPLLLEEFQAVTRAQLVRGGGGRPGPWARALALPALIVPLFVLSIVRAQALAEAMESRGYRGAEGRSPLPPRRWSGPDVTVLTVAILQLLGAVGLAFVPGPGAR